MYCVAIFLPSRLNFFLISLFRHKCIIFFANSYSLFGSNKYPFFPSTTISLADAIDFDTINGPDLRIYLSSDLGSADIVELGKIKATKGNVNYDIPEGTDLEIYKNVLVWCKPFGVLFSFAQLI